MGKRFPTLAPVLLLLLLIGAAALLLVRGFVGGIRMTPPSHNCK